MPLLRPDVPPAHAGADPYPEVSLRTSICTGFGDPAEGGASASCLSVASWMPPPNAAAGSRGREAGKPKQATVNKAGEHSPSGFHCEPRGVHTKEPTSGWRIGTQPASFSYSSIASAILVVMLAEHCGKQEGGNRQRRGGGCQRH